MIPVVPPPYVALLKSAEAARALGVSRRTILHWTTIGRLAGVETLGGHHRYAREAVADLAAEFGHAWPTIERDQAIAKALGVEDYRQEVDRHGL